MKYPFIKYVETLILRKLPPEDVVADLTTYNLVMPVEDILIIRTGLESAFPEYFKSAEVIPSSGVLAEVNVEEMFGYLYKIDTPTGYVGVKGAFEILNDMLMYRLITALALSKITEEDIELIVNGKYNISYTHEDIAIFLHYFFNVKKWTITDKKSLVRRTKGHFLQQAYRTALEHDKNYLIWKLGASPDKSFDSMLKDMMNDAYYNFTERSTVDPELAQKWGALAVKLADKIERLGKDKQKQEDFHSEVVFKLEQHRLGHREELEEPPHLSEIVKDDA